MRSKSGIGAKLIVGVIVLVWLAVAALIFFVLLPEKRHSIEADKRATVSMEERCKTAPVEQLTVSRKELAPLVESTALSSSGKLTPVLSGTTAQGFRVWDIRPGSLYDVVGLCDGDVVIQVGNRRLDTPESALQVYEEVKGLSEIKVVLRRKTQLHTYAIVLD